MGGAPKDGAGQDGGGECGGGKYGGGEYGGAEDDWADLEETGPEGNGGDALGPGPVALTVPDEAAGARLDKALGMAAAEIPGLSRSRLAALIEAGAVEGPRGPATDPRVKARAGETYGVAIPPPLPAEPEPEAIPLEILHEDADLIVVEKPAGMVVHPAPGAATGTLVNALLHHCGPDFARIGGGIGGRARPGIVHRIDKDTSGILVVAKTDAAHEGLSRQFAAHTVERRYLALLWGGPDRADPRLAGLPATTFEPEGWIRIEAPIGRHPADRKKMAVRRDGRHAVTRLRPIERFRDSAGQPFASFGECRLETGRTHQIRVHAAHIGHPLVGDPVYGRARVLSAERVPEAVRICLDTLPRQALHATDLAFVHPRTGEAVGFTSPLPGDMAAALSLLRRSGEGLP